jgi:hypothetical protein
MYRKHGNEFVVKMTDVWPLIPVASELTEEQKSDERLVQFHAEYQAWIAQGNVPLEQAES